MARLTSGWTPTKKPKSTFDPGHRSSGGRVVLIGGLFLLIALNVPVAYALGLSAMVTSLYIGIPLEAILLKVSDGVDTPFRSSCLQAR